MAYVCVFLSFVGTTATFVMVHLWDWEVKRLRHESIAKDIERERVRAKALGYAIEDIDEFTAKYNKETHSLDHPELESIAYINPKPHSEPLEIAEEIQRRYTQPLLVKSSTTAANM